MSYANSSRRGYRENLLPVNAQNPREKGPGFGCGRGAAALVAVAMLFLALPTGCSVPTPLAALSGVPNAFGVPFRNRSEVVAAIPVGTGEDKAEAIMRAHGFDQWTSTRSGQSTTISFHICDLALARAAGDVWVSLFFDHEKLVDAEVGNADRYVNRSPWDP